jgi:hypothetical protein
LGGGRRPTVNPFKHTRLIVETLEDCVVPAVPAAVGFPTATLRPTVYVGDLVAVSTVALSGTPSGAVTVDYGTSDRTATAGTDYTAESGTLTFEPGQRSRTIDIPILGPIGDPHNTFAVTLSNPSGAVLAISTQTITLTVANPVALTNPGNQSNYDGDPVSLATSASDALTYSDVVSGVDTLPPGLSIDPNTGAISGTIAGNADLYSAYSVTITATDSTAGASASQPFTWTVNNPVSLTSPGNQTNFDGDTVSLPLTASDAEGNTLTFSDTGLPSGLSIDPNTGAISGTIAGNADLYSAYSVTVTATDSTAGASASQPFTWTVNNPVTLTNPGNQTNFDGDTVSLPPLTASDAEGNTLTFSETGLPSGLNIDPNTGVISGTIAGNADLDSAYSVTITATDSTAGASASQPFTWTVTNPVTLANPGNQSNYDGDTVSLATSASDALGNALTYSDVVSGVDTLPPGLSVDPNSGVISGTIAGNADTNSPYSVTITATDSAAGASASQIFNWAVAQPTVTLTNPGDQSNYDGDAVTLNFSASDTATSHALTYSVASGALPSGLSLNPNNGQITGTIAMGDSAESPYSINVTATDGAADVSDTQAFNWNVSPTITWTYPGDQTNNDGDTVSLQLSATDSAGNALVYSVDNSTPLPPGLSIDPNTGMISGTIASNADVNSPYEVAATATDNTANVSDTVVFGFIVNPLTAPGPVVNSLNAEILPGHQVEFTGNASDNGNFDGITINFYGDTVGATTTDAEGDFDFTTQEAVLGSVYAIATDAEQNQSQPTFASLATDTPVVALAVQQVTANSVTVSGTISDVDHAYQPIQISGITNGTASTDANGNFTFTGYVSNVGEIDASATDEWGQTSNTADVTVSSLPVANSPTLSLYAQILPGQQVELTGQLLDANPAGATVTFSGAATGSTTTDANGNFSFIADSASLGTVYASAVDQAQQTTNLAHATIADSGPIITFTVSSMSQTSVTITGSVTDVDKQGISVQASGFASGSTLTDANGNFTFTSALGAGGAVLVSATDLWGASDTLGVRFDTGGDAIPTAFIPDAPSYPPVPASERAYQARLQTWRVGRTATQTFGTGFNFNGNTGSFRSTANWFTDADANTLSAQLAQVRAAITTILIDLANYTIPNHRPPNTIEQNINRWFGNGNPLTGAQLAAVRRVFTQVAIRVDNNTTVYWDRSFDVSNWGQVSSNWFSTYYNSVQLGAPYFSEDSTPRDKIGTLIHELTHLYCNTEDYGYFDDPSSFTNPAVTYTKRGVAVTLTPAQQVDNADSFAGFLAQYYLS